jgi:2-polyprenyl-3-methyl-5-hydroxy-6-metoxy-1,4-benzoquinol methylase
MAKTKTPKATCFICGNKRFRKMFRVDHGYLNQCSKCGLVLLDSENKDKGILNIYKDENYYGQSDDNSLTYKSYLEEKEVYLKYFNNKLKNIENNILKGKILDIGCGLGFFLEVAEKRGWRAEGVEVSNYAASYLSKNKYKAYCGELESLKLAEKSYDVITLFSVIEHLSNPLETLKEIRRLLKPDGLLIITAANQKGLLATFLGKRWFQYKYHGHLYFFSSVTLTKLLNKVGFTNIKIEREMFQTIPLSFILSRLDYLYKFPFVKELHKVKFIKNIIIPFAFDYLFLVIKA